MTMVYRPSRWFVAAVFIAQVTVYAAASLFLAPIADVVFIGSMAIAIRAFFTRVIDSGDTLQVVNFLESTDPIAVGSLAYVPEEPVRKFTITRVGGGGISVDVMRWMREEQRVELRDRFAAFERPAFPDNS